MVYRQKLALVSANSSIWLPKAWKNMKGKLDASCATIRYSIDLLNFSDYKVEYEKLRKEKLAEERKTTEERLTQIKEAKALGTEVPMDSFITEMSSGRDLTDIYLKHPANESSEDEDGNEQEFVSNGDDEKEERNFQSFVASHATKQENKIKLAKVQEKPWFWQKRTVFLL